MSTLSRGSCHHGGLHCCRPQAAAALLGSEDDVLNADPFQEGVPPLENRFHDAFVLSVIDMDVVPLVGAPWNRYPDCVPFFKKRFWLIDNYYSGPPCGRYVYLRCYFVVTARSSLGPSVCPLSRPLFHIARPDTLHRMNEEPKYHLSEGGFDHSSIGIFDRIALCDSQ